MSVLIILPLRNYINIYFFNCKILTAESENEVKKIIFATVC
jgi:hypothetical protein